MADQLQNDVIPFIPPATGAEEMNLTSTIGGQEIVEARVGMYLTNEPASGLKQVPTIVYRACPTPEQRAKIAAGEDIYLVVMTYGKPPQPTWAQVGAGAFQKASTTIIDPFTGEGAVKEQSPIILVDDGVRNRPKS